MQGATTSPIAGGVNITGVFSDTAKGWFIILSNNSADFFIALPDTSGPAIVTALETGRYSVIVYDLTGGLPERKPAVIDEVNITEEGEGEHNRNSLWIRLGIYSGGS